MLQEFYTSTLETIGQLTKWMSEPPKRSPWKVTHSKNPGVKADVGSQMDGKYVDYMSFEDKASKLAYRPYIDLVRDQNCMIIDFGWHLEISMYAQ